jgi:hypothetical protein
MRYRLMATYLGVPYYAGLGPDGNEATLFSPAPPPDELGFAPAGGCWRKQVAVPDLDALWQSRLTGEYRGEPCLVLDDLGDRLHIAYQGRDSARARQLGYWEIDREVFEVVVARPDVTGLTEERVDYPLQAAMFPPSNRDPGIPPRPEAHGRAAQAPGGAVFPPVSPAPPVSSPGSAAMPPAAERTSPLRMVPRSGPQPALGYAEADRARRTPDRAAAWHGSPETEPWSQPPPPPPRPEPRSEPRPEPRLDPRSDPRTDPRREFRAEPWPRSEARSEPRPTGGPEPRAKPTAVPPGPPVPSGPPGPQAGRRAGRRDRVPQSVFGELLSLAAIPHSAYAVDEEVPGAMCLVKADGGFEVFSRTDDARLDVRFFEDEEAAYFYLFGVLASEAVRSGRLQPSQPGPVNGHANGSRGPRNPTAPTENISKYLPGRKLPKSVPPPVIVN